LPYTFCEQTGKEIKDISDEIPFEIPESWEWVRFDNATLYSTDYVANGSFSSLRENVKTYKEPNYAIMVKTADFANGFSNNLTYTDKYGFDFLSKSELHGGELMLSNIGASIGKAFIIPKLDLPMTLAPNSIVVSCYTNTTMYFYYLMLSGYGQDLLKQFTAGTAMPKFSKTQLRNALIPLPPLSEQHRIVAKIEELLPYIEQYNKAETQLTTLNTTFPEMLKKSILQEAVQGKLVPQDPNDEPASVLLERIRAEKQELIRQGKIKKDKHESVIFTRDKIPYEKRDGVERCIADEVPFEIPEGWCWCRLGTIFQHNTGKALNSSNHQGTKMQYITTSNLYWNRFELEKLKEMLFTDNEVEKCTAQKGDLLVCEGGDIGRAAIWNYDYPMRIQNHIHRLRPYSKICIDFYYYVFYFYKHAGLIGGKGIGIQGLSSNAIDSLFIPLPPLTEQKRIVAKIEELMQYCEKLK
jgi:type I restriction enzyme S subunit